MYKTGAHGGQSRKSSTRAPPLQLKGVLVGRAGCIRHDVKLVDHVLRSTTTNATA